MATVFQSAELVNDIQRQMIGEKAVSITNTTQLMDFGKVVFSSATNVSLFYKVLADRYVRMYVAMKVYKAKNRKLRRNNLEWGMYISQVRAKHKSRATNNPALDREGMQHSPYDVQPTTEIILQMFGKNLPTWTLEDVMPGETQLFTAFTSFEEMDKFVAACGIAIRNEIESEMEALDNLCIATMIANVYKKGTPSQKVNVVKLYNTQFGANLTNETCRHDPNYLKFRVQLMRNTMNLLKVRSVLYNIEKEDNFIQNDEDLIVEVLAEAASDITTYMTSDTYHKEFVALPGYIEVPCWQALGDANNYTSHSAVKIKNDDIDTAAVEVNNVIAVMRSANAAGTHFDKQREWAKYNERDDVTPYGIQFVRSYVIDTYEDCVIFYDDANEV